jgi:ABC-type multidrug transport system ATPase subunit
MTAILETKDLTKRYNQVLALDGLSLSVEDGISGLVGPNGAGKTTLIRIALGLIKESSGSIRIMDKSPALARRNVGAVFDKVALPQELQVDFFLERVCEIFGSEKNEIPSVLELTELKTVKNKPIGSLSLGYLRRLSIAQAVVHGPDIVIADEPFAQLDPLVKIDLKDSILRLRKEKGTSFFISSHDLFDVDYVCDTVHIIREGKIAASRHRGYEKGYVVRAENNESLAEYLEKNSLQVRIDKDAVRVLSTDMKQILSLLAIYDGKIFEVRSVSTEELLRDVIDKGAP